MERRCSSSLAAEAYALVQGVVLAEWMMQTLAEMSNAAFDATFFRKLVESLRRHLIVTDAKSLYANIKKEAGTRGKEPRISLAASEAAEKLVRGCVCLD
eukprot:6090892-Amphidinium_carterae.1